MIDSSLFEKAVPDPTRSMRLPGLESTVEVHRDALGVPHVRTHSTHDAFFAQGFVHAQDRSWQMTYDRFKAAGRLSELIGPRALTLDIFIRRLGINASAHRDYEGYDEKTKAVVDAYAAGVNAFTQTTDALPAELTLLEIDLDPWEPWQCAAVMKARHVLMGNYDRKLWRAHLLNRIGPEAVVTVGSGDGREDTLVIPVDGRAVWKARPGEIEPGSLATAGVVDGSNNWVVHGSRTASGLPLVAGDPHRTLEVPNVYYQNHVACPEFDAIGFSIPGVPGMYHFGHNGKVAWSITHAMADTQDLYVERFSEEGLYEFAGEWLEPERRGERVSVRDASPVEIEVTVTRHGPVVFGDPRSGSAVAMQWTGTDRPDTTLRCVLPMLRASSVEELDESMRWWVDPCNNLVMADNNGTIGYLFRGRVPVRSRANGWVPVPGWTGEYEWTGDVPFEELPRLRNPDAGYIATANNRVVADDGSAYLGMDYAAPYRVRRVLARLAELDRATADDMASIHADRLSLASSIFKRASKGNGEVRRILERWDGRMEPDQAGPTIFAVMREKVAEILCESKPLRDVVDLPYEEEPIPTPAHTRVRVALARLIEQNDTSMISGRRWDDVIGEALDRADAALSEILGDDPSQWLWSRIHKTQLVHPLSRVFPDAANVLNPPSVSCGGDGETVQATGWEMGLGVQHGAVARYVFDIGDWDRSGWIVPLGSSAHPGSPHYADQAAGWAKVELRPMIYSWERIERGAESRQTLEPSK